MEPMPVPHKPELSESERFFAAPDSGMPPLPEAPPGYPQQDQPPPYHGEPIGGGYEARRHAFLALWAARPAPRTVKGAYAELARLALGVWPVHEPLLLRVADFVEKRYDCADFTIHLLLRILYQYEGSPLLDAATVDRIRAVVLGFKYSPWEPGIDSMCTWTENHQILFASAEYLAGARYPERVFTNSGQTGTEKRDAARRRIDRWLELRFVTGFSEWLSHVYYDEDITALLSLSDFAVDPVLARRARMILDLMLIDVAANSLRGVFGSTHGRSYPREKRFADTEATSDICTIVFGTGRSTGCDAMGAFALAVSPTYQPPPVVEEISSDMGDGVVENRQRMSFDIAEAAEYGIDKRRELDRFMLLTQESYLHPRTASGFIDLMERFGWWNNRFFQPFAPFRGLLRTLRVLRLLPVLARLVRHDATRNTREAVSIITRRSEHTLLSAAVDYRHGYGGDQQHIWQATLGPRAVVFVNHPGSASHGSAGYWVGEGTLPRVAVHERRLIAIYRPSRSPGLYRPNRFFFTHAWFPTHEFEEVRRAGHWFFARLRSGYVALASRNPVRWGGRQPDSEVVADDGPNIWLCRVGSEAEDGSFDRFVEQCATSMIDWGPRRSRLSVKWRISGRSDLQFGWRGPFRVDGVEQPLHSRHRYLNPWADVPFGARSMTFAAGGRRLLLDYDRAERRIS